MTSGWIVTGIGVKQFQFVDPQRAPGVRNKHGFEERTVSIFSASTGQWSRAQWQPTDCLWRDEAKSRCAYAAARQMAAVDGNLSIQMAAIKLRKAARDAGEYDPTEQL